jgi:hypothetical protein
MTVPTECVAQNYNVKQMPHMPETFCTTHHQPHSRENTGGGEEAAKVAAQAMLLLPPPELHADQQLHAA